MVADNNPDRPNPIRQRHDEIRRLSLALMDAIDQQLLRIADVAAACSDDDPAHTALTRETAHALELWRECDQSACRRAQECRRPASGCLSRRAQMKPSLRAEMIALLRRRREELTALQRDLRKGIRAVTMVS